MILEFAAGVVLGLAAARVVSVVATRIFERAVVEVVARMSPTRLMPAWFWPTAEIITGRRWR